MPLRYETLLGKPLSVQFLLPYIRLRSQGLLEAMKKTVWRAMIDQWSKIPPVTHVDLTGQTVVVVGANTGISLAAAKHFARMNPAKLILGCRSEDKGRRAISNTFQNESRLDILVMNAGIIALDRKETDDGWEEVLQVNDLSTSLTSLLLVPKMVETGNIHGTHPRIVIVSSDSHHMAEFDHSTMSAQSSLRALSDNLSIDKRYEESKLLDNFFSQSLASLLASTPVIVDAVHPGYCYSDIRRDVKGIVAALHWRAEKIFAFTTDEGGRQLVWAAVGCSENVDALRGAYIVVMKVEEPANFLLGEEGRKRAAKLWADLIRELSKVDRRVADIVGQYT